MFNIFLLTLSPYAFLSLCISVFLCLSVSLSLFLFSLSVSVCLSSLFSSLSFFSADLWAVCPCLTDSWTPPLPPLSLFSYRLSPSSIQPLTSSYRVLLVLTKRHRALIRNFRRYSRLSTFRREITPNLKFDISL